ncbi:chemotaxis protein CheW [Psychrosphaera haliotis]|uniref:Chemotaxis protein CheW n=2 Tax=Psychrosphaera haliotis TaxID=555083 RepID=A0A6N8F6K4_9GAMM|nr:chemotaxis protein CheW [Psychrosphaera haliotis]MUH72195.1 chemotaxis protein CheW [Psychrosphaera haliotis]
MQQQEAAEALALKEEQEVSVEPIVEEKVSAVTETLTKTLTETSTETKMVSETVTDLKTHTEAEVGTNVQVEAEEKLETTVATKSIDKIEEPFQALFFEVAGLSLAVPLHELGGIHNLEDVTSLFGKPDWFLGVMVNREKKINVVESAKWVMPEKYDSLQTKPDYKYLIMLGESNWGLAAEKLVTTEYIKPDDVKWRSQPGKRPWLLGTIKEKMCALLHVDDLVAMLNKGINARQE